MEAKIIDSHLIIRVPRGEELIAGITQACKDHGVMAGVVSGIGATDNVTMGVYSVETSKYDKHTIKDQEMEIVSLMGNVSTLNGEFYLHLHISVSDSQGHLFGGHLNECQISATSEIFINIIDGEVERFSNEKTGLNELKLL